MRSLLYALARLMGDINAVQRGPGAVVKRIGRKVVLRGAGGLVGKLFK